MCRWSHVGLCIWANCTTESDLGLVVRFWVNSATKGYYSWAAVEELDLAMKADLGGDCWL